MTDSEQTSKDKIKKLSIWLIGDLIVCRIRNSGENLDKINLDEDKDDTWLMQESANSDIFVKAKDKAIQFSPHAGRGSGKDDRNLNAAIMSFKKYLEDKGIESKFGRII